VIVASCSLSTERGECKATGRVIVAPAESRRLIVIVHPRFAMIGLRVKESWERDEMDSRTQIIVCWLQQLEFCKSREEEQTEGEREN
jgi:hypothetical protein